MPCRTVPFLHNARHEVSPDLDFDWTLCPEDQALEWQRRQVRNDMIKADLLAGKDVVFRSSGHSLWPRVKSNDGTQYTPVTRDEEVTVDDIVFCEVKDKYFAHLVKKKEWFASGYCYTIARLDGRENGWCTINTIHGRLVDQWR
jgi:hypothetical protein